MSESLQTDFYQSQYLQHFNNFVQQLKVIFPSDDTINILSTIESYSDEVKIARGQLFCSSIRDENFDLFLKGKIKVFSHKSEDTQTISESLFGTDFCLKNLLNNQPDEVKKIIWINLHTLCMISELLKSDELHDQEKVSMLNKVISKEKGLDNVDETISGSKNLGSENSGSENSGPETNKKLQEMLGVDVNKETSFMIEDIVGSFEKILTNQSNANPLAGIMEISQKISVKYADKINKGEIELDKLMQAISKKVPGMEQMMGGMMGGSMGGSSDGSMGGMGEMIGGLMGGLMGGKSKPKEKILIDENFSTANINVGMNKESESKSNMNIASILKMADQMGVIPGGKHTFGNSNGDDDGNDDNNGGGIPGIGKVMEIMQKLEKTNTKEEADALKLEMDTFLQKELGVDVDKLNEQLESVTKQMESNTLDDQSNN